jgi:uncharacterized protein
MYLIWIWGEAMKRFIIVLIILCIVLSSVIFVINKYQVDVRYYINLAIHHVQKIKSIKVPEEYSTADSNMNGIPDCLDVVTAARKEVTNKIVYKDAYYVGGYPPDKEGVCTDVIWRGFKGMGVDLKAAIDKDIKNNLSAYPRVENKPDPNIDFRRVKNMDTFLKRNTVNVTKELKPFDVENLKQWQPGDIVVIMQPFEHIAIISDKRANDGVPYVIHNTTPHAVESSSLAYWAPYIFGHYRWKY